jgi:F-type H+-transporting ATPase subunit epsilon
MKEMKLEIITPSKCAFSGEIESLSVPGSKGSFQVLFNHAPILSTFEIGKLKIVDSDKKEIEFATSGGTIEVLANKILVLAETVETKDEIDVKRAQESFERAKERLSNRAKETDIPRAEGAYARAVNRLKMAGQYKAKA